MIEIKSEQASALYKAIKDIILAKENESEYQYNKKYHNLYEKEASRELQENFYNENGSVEIQNILGETIVIEINRWHPHKHNGWSGLNSTPCRSAIIYIRDGDEKKKLYQKEILKLKKLLNQ